MHSRARIIVYAVRLDCHLHLSVPLCYQIFPFCHFPHLFMRRIAPAVFVYAQIRFMLFACFVGVIRAVRSTNLAGLSLLPICTVPKKFEWK